MKKLQLKNVYPYRISNLIIILSCILFTSQVHANVNYETVIVGNPGNANDITGFGGVDYVYNIGKYGVTIGQYAAFLNAVATESDPYSLWSSSMMNPNIQGISRAGSAGSYSYNIMNTSSGGVSSESMPITYVSWFSAARFANWMANNQPTGPESSGTTENGAYNLNGATKGLAVAKNLINPNTNEAPSFYIPLENEWYKAAYYNGDGKYYTYATQSDTLPSNVIGSGSNLANYLADYANGYCVSQSMLYSTTQTYLTNVGTFSNSGSHYDTFDQTGGLWEWTDLNGESSLIRGLRGGAWTSTPPYIQSSYRLMSIPSIASVNNGFRLASSVLGYPNR